MIKGGEISADTEFSWVYKIRGIELTGKGKVVSLIRNQRLILQMDSLLPIRKTIEFRVEGDGTILTVEVGHKSPGRVLSFLFSAVRKVLNIMETMSVLNRIKAFCESELNKDRKIAQNS